MTLHNVFGVRVEVQDIADQKAELRTQQIAPLTENRVGVLCAPFQPAFADRGGERHVALLHRHVQMPEHGRELGIVLLIEDDEAGVDRNLRAVIVDGQRARVAADPVCLLIYRDVVLAVQDVGGAEARNPCADDRDLCHVPFRWFANGTDAAKRRIKAGQGQFSVIRLLSSPVEAAMEQAR